MKGFEPSLLEKLFDDEPRSPERGMFKRFTMERFKESVARDLEALLNTRAAIDESVLGAFPECRSSLATYGMPDFSGLSLASAHDRARICASLESGIRTHEPRLREVHVELEPELGSVTGLRFQISALLMAHPASEPVSFDAMLQPSTLQYRIAPQRRQAA